MEKLSEINAIINVCNSLVTYIENNGTICNGNTLYNYYKELVRNYIRKYNIDKLNSRLFREIDSLYFSSHSYFVDLSEAKKIRELIIELKHFMCPDACDGIFISHREKDKKQVDEFVSLLHCIGIPRPTNESENLIFCTSHPESYIQNGARNLDEIKAQFSTEKNMFFILWYTDAYFESQACLNEAGAIWVTGKPYQEILSPTLDSSKIGGLMDKQVTWFRSNDKYKLNNFKEQIEKMFDLTPITQNAWEHERDRYIENIERILTTTEETT